MVISCCLKLKGRILLDRSGARGEAKGPKCNSQTFQEARSRFVKKRACTNMTHDNTYTFNIYIDFKKTERQKNIFVRSEFNTVTEMNHI